MGLAIPHVEARFKGRDTGRYQLAGPAAQVLAGVSHPLSGRWSLFGEYRLNRAWLREDLSGGATASLSPWLHQVVVGVGAARP